MTFVQIPPGDSKFVTFTVFENDKLVAVKEIADISIGCSNAQAVPTLWIPAPVLSVDGFMVTKGAVDLRGSEIVQMVSNYVDPWTPNTRAGETVRWILYLVDIDAEFRIENDTRQAHPSSVNLVRNLHGYHGLVYSKCETVKRDGTVVRESRWSPAVRVDCEWEAETETGADIDALAANVASALAEASGGGSFQSQQEEFDEAY